MTYQQHQLSAEHACEWLVTEYNSNGMALCFASAGRILILTAPVCYSDPTERERGSRQKETLVTSKRTTVALSGPELPLPTLNKENRPRQS